MKKFLIDVCGQVSNQALFWVVFAVLVAGFVLISSTKEQGVAPSAQQLFLPPYGVGIATPGTCPAGHYLKNDGTCLKITDQSVCDELYKPGTSMFYGNSNLGYCTPISYAPSPVLFPGSLPSIPVLPSYTSQPPIYNPAITGFNSNSDSLLTPFTVPLNNFHESAPVISCPDGSCLLDSECDDEETQKPPLVRSVNKRVCELFDGGQLNQYCDGHLVKNNAPQSDIIHYQNGCSLHFGRFNDPYSGGYNTDKTKSELQNVCENGTLDSETGNIVAIFEAEGGSEVAGELDESEEEDDEVSSAEEGSLTSGSLRARTCAIGEEEKFSTNYPARSANGFVCESGRAYSVLCDGVVTRDFCYVPPIRRGSF